MREEKYIATLRENIIAFARVYNKSPDERVLERIILTYRIYIEAAEDYLELDHDLWTIEKENYFISVISDLNILTENLIQDISVNHIGKLATSAHLKH